MKPESQSMELATMSSVAPEQVQMVLQQAEAFRQVIQRTLRQGVDYGVIPNTSGKPVLLKPGAEKILMALGIRSEFVIEEARTDWDRGFFYYRVRCALYKGDVLITEGLGSANSFETKFKRKNPADVENTVLKMAKKRALVDAVLLVASLSDVFTQDIEDDEELVPSTEGQGEVQEPAGGSAAVSGASNQGGAGARRITDKQIKRLWALAKDAEAIKAALAEFGFERAQDVTMDAYEQVVARAIEIAEELHANEGEDVPF